MAKAKGKPCGGREAMSKRVASVASEMFQKGRATPEEAMTMAGSTLGEREP